MFEIDGRAAYPRRTHSRSSATPRSSTGSLNGSVRAFALGRWDQSYSRAMHDLLARTAVSFTAIRYQGVDAIGHHYLRYAQPRTFGDVVRRGASEVRRRARALLRVHRRRRSARALDHLAPGDLLLVVSGFGMEPVSPVKHLAGRVDCVTPTSVARTSARPTAFCWPTVSAVAAGRYQRGSIVDVAPTILYFLGLPVGRDMDGYARADIFTRAFTAERPITFIPSHTR